VLEVVAVVVGATLDDVDDDVVAAASRPRAVSGSAEHPGPSAQPATIAASQPSTVRFTRSPPGQHSDGQGGCQQRPTRLPAILFESGT